MNNNTKVEELVKKWLEDKGFDYDIKTYMPGEVTCDGEGRSKDTISVPVEVENIELFMEQFIKSFKEINEMTTLRKQV